MAQRSHGVRIEQVAASRGDAKVEGLLFCGGGPDVVLAVSEATGQSSVAILDAIVHDLLVQKGADWTSVILSEYLGVYDDSHGNFVLVWDQLTEQLVAHGASFQSASHPCAGLLAHIRTVDGFQGLGLGGLVTAEATRAVFDHGGEVVVLETDDKIHRREAAGRGAHTLYARLGYTILGEKRLADTIDWMMAVDRPLFVEFERARKEGRAAPMAALQQQELVYSIRSSFEELEGELSFEPAGPGDLANLFLLLNLCPPGDFRLKLHSWHVEHGPELERAFIATLRQGIVDQDRLQDASLLLRDGRGAVVAVCAARQVAPFTRHTYAVDFYCLPALLGSRRGMVVELVERTLSRVLESPVRPRPCRFEFHGVDEAKISLFHSLGFEPAQGSFQLFDPAGGPSLVAQEYFKIVP